MTPQQIDALRTQAEIDRAVRRSLAPAVLDELEKRALTQHPPVFRSTQPVPSAIRQAETQMVQGRAARQRRLPLRKRHILP